METKWKYVREDHWQGASDSWLEHFKQHRKGKEFKQVEEDRGTNKLGFEVTKWVIYERDL